jgi:hypothetical protein
VPDAAVPDAGGKHERRFKLVTGLEWILAPGYREVGKGHTVLEIAEGNEEDEQGTSVYSGKTPKDCS